MKEFIKYVSLNVLGMLGLSCYVLADTFFVAQKLGPTGLAALNFSIPIFSIIQGIGLMLGIGGATRFSIAKSQNRNKKQEKDLDTSFTHAVVLCIIASLAIWMIALFGSKALAQLLGANGEILKLTLTYIKMIMWFSPFFILNNILVSFVRNDGNPKLAMNAMLISSFSNIILDYIFMYPFGMGMFGAVLATSISPIISLLILTKHIRSGKCSFHFLRCKLQIAVMGKISACGFSSFIAELASAISLITFNLVIMKINGELGVAAYGIVANIALIVTAIFTGIAQGVQPLVSRFYGKEDSKELNRVIKMGILTALSLFAVIFIIIMFGSNLIISAFDSENNLEMRNIASQGMKLYFIGYLFASINILVVTILSATTKVKIAFIISNLRSWLLFIPAILVLTKMFGMCGVWCSFLVTEFIVILFSGQALMRYMKRWYGS